MTTVPIPETPPARWLLALDTSTEQAGIALHDGDRVAEASWPAGREQTVTVLAQVHALLTLIGLEVGELGAIGVATGPGTFNGLRVGLGIAKGLLLGLGPEVAIVGVPTLDAAALPFVAAGGPVVPIVAAGRGRLIWATYAPAAPGQHRTTDPRNGTIDELVAHLAALPAGTVVTGELDQAQESLLAAVPGLILPPRSLRARRPAAVAELAWRRWRAGDGDDPATLAPVYLSR